MFFKISFHEFVGEVLKKSFVKLKTLTEKIIQQLKLINPQVPHGNSSAVFPSQIALFPRSLLIALSLNVIARFVILRRFAFSFVSHLFSCSRDSCREAMKVHMIFYHYRAAE